MRTLNSESVAERLCSAPEDAVAAMERNDFPKPVKFGGTRVWVESEVEAWAVKHGYSEAGSDRSPRTLRQKAAEKKKHDLFFSEQSNTLTGRAIRSNREIVKAAQAGTAARVSGVYFLVKGTRVVYVGQSTNVYSRAANHFSNKEFDNWCFIPCKKEELDVLESLYIHFLRPPQNGRMNGTEIISAPITVNDLLSRIRVDGLSEVES
jgi:predicted DNA-binding transcriptional regulator AlpA